MRGEGSVTLVVSLMSGGEQLQKEPRARVRPAPAKEGHCEGKSGANSHSSKFWKPEDEAILRDRREERDAVFRCTVQYLFLL